MNPSSIVGVPPFADQVLLTLPLYDRSARVVEELQVCIDRVGMHRKRVSTLARRPAGKRVRGALTLAGVPSHFVLGTRWWSRRALRTLAAVDRTAPSP